MQEFKPVKEGKVREVYDNGDSLIIVATDRISAFDHILKNKITDKVRILVFKCMNDVIIQLLALFVLPRILPLIIRDNILIVIQKQRFDTFLFCY